MEAINVKRAPEPRLTDAFTGSAFRAALLTQASEGLSSLPLAYLFLYLSPAGNGQSSLRLEVCTTSAAYFYFFEAICLNTRIEGACECSYHSCLYSARGPPSVIKYACKGVIIFACLAEVQHAIAKG